MLSAFLLPVEFSLALANLFLACKLLVIRVCKLSLKLAFRLNSLVFFLLITVVAVLGFESVLLAKSFGF